MWFKMVKSSSQNCGLLLVKFILAGKSRLNQPNESCTTPIQAPGCMMSGANMWVYLVRTLVITHTHMYIYIIHMQI